MPPHYLVFGDLNPLPALRFFLANLQSRIVLLVPVAVDRARAGGTSVANALCGFSYYTLV